jgi:hypothetical protein
MKKMSTEHQKETMADLSTGDVNFALQCQVAAEIELSHY